VLLLIVPILGCAPMGPPGGVAADDDQPSQSGNVFVEPAVVDFDVFTFPEKPGDPQFLTSTFTVFNASTEDMVLHGQGTVIGSDAFSVNAPPAEHLIGHELVEYTVVFQPQVDDVYSGQIELDFGDAVVELRGEAHAPRLAVDEEIDITTPYRCIGDHSLRVENIGHELLELDLNDFSEAGPKYGLSWVSDEPLDLEPGDVAELGFTFAPNLAAIGENEIEARIGTNEPGEAIRTIVINAEATVVADTVESFRFDTELQTSLLIVPDTRASMATALEAFASTADALVAAIAAKGDNDVNVAVVGGYDDVPCPTTERAYYNTDDDDLVAGIAEGLADAGASTGNLLDLAQGAVYQMGDGGCLAGFLRPATSLHVLVLSDGSEDSFNDPSMYAQSIANQVEALHGTSVEISVFVPGGEACTDEGCTRLVAASHALTPNAAIWDLSTSDWNETLAAYGASLVPPPGWIPLVLSQRAQYDAPEDIEVTFGDDDTRVDSDLYSYNSGPQAVMLDMAAPIPAGETVRVAYLPSAVCE
jgi:hypothetical protein